MEGIIIKNISNDYVIQTNNNQYTCKPRGKFRHQGEIPLVGDHVIFDEKKRYILTILPRKNHLIRPSVANIDQALIATSVKEPNFNTNLLDKLLTIISYNNITPIICLTKLDLLTQAERETINTYIQYYQKIGYQVITNDDQEMLKQILPHKVTVLTGQSGAGKSTLLNRLDNHLQLKTAPISKALGRGKHTTRHVELYPIHHGFVVDTPGFSSLDLSSMSNIDIRDNMKEMFDNLPRCQYRDCLHIKEDKCQIKKMVANNEILKSRYDNYKNFIERK